MIEEVEWSSPASNTVVIIFVKCFSCYKKKGDRTKW